MFSILISHILCYNFHSAFGLGWALLGGLFYSSLQDEMRQTAPIKRFLQDLLLLINTDYLRLNTNCQGSSTL